MERMGCGYEPETALALWCIGKEGVGRDEEVAERTRIELIVQEAAWHGVRCGKMLGMYHTLCNCICICSNCIFVVRI